MDKSVSRMNLRERWQEYERRKSEIIRLNLDSSDYEKKIREIAHELGI